MDTAGFLSGLWRLQAERGLTDAALSRQLGVNQSTVHRLKNEPERRPGLRLALTIVREYPELAPFLGGDLRIGQCSIPIRQDEEV